MIPADFEYVRARTLKEAVTALAKGDGAKLIAGGHSLIPLLRFRLASPSILIDVAGLEELKGVEAKGRSVRIGAGSTYREVLEAPVIAERYPVLIEAVSTIGDLQVRNAGTVGGAIAHADPASDLPAVLLALDATLNVRSKNGKRSIAAKEFFQGAFTTAIKDDEVLVDITLPAPPKKSGMAYVSFEQQASGYALAAAAAIVTRSRKTISSAIVTIAGVSDRPYFADVSGVVGTHGEEADLDRAVAGVTAGVTVSSDLHASTEYRTQLAKTAAKRAISVAYDRAG
jgi:carbon-monoxide dehydrogenase medium subunit